MPGRNNVTPFRPRKPKRGVPGEGLRTPRGQVLLLHGLTLLSFGLSLASGIPASGIPSEARWLALAFGVAAVAIAASRRQEGMPWARTHHEFGLRTVIIGAVLWTLSGLAAIIPGAGLLSFYAMLAIVGWVGVRALAGLVRGFLRLPFANPKTPFL